MKSIPPDLLYRALVAGHTEIDITASDISELDVIPIDDRHFHVIHDSESLQIEVLHHDAEDKIVELRIRDRIFTIELNDRVELLVKEMGFERNNTSDINEIKAPMPGKVLSIETAQGEEVSEGSPLIILEAMKMENVLPAPRDAIVSKVHVKVGQTVDKAQVLVSLE